MNGLLDRLALSEEQRATYEAKATQDKKRYDDEKRVYILASNASVGVCARSRNAITEAKDKYTTLSQSTGGSMVQKHSEQTDVALNTIGSQIQLPWHLASNIEGRRAEKTIERMNQHARISQGVEDHSI